MRDPVIANLEQAHTNITFILSHIKSPTQHITAGSIQHSLEGTRTLIDKSLRELKRHPQKSREQEVTEMDNDRGYKGHGI